MPSILSIVIAAIVSVCAARPRFVVVALLAAAAVAGVYAAGHFKMYTQTEELLSPQLPFRVDERNFNAAFNKAEPGMIAVINGATPEIAEDAAARLAAAMTARTDLFQRVQRPDGGGFFAKNGLLFLSTDEVKSTTDELLKAAPLLGPLAQDTSVHGIADSLGVALDGVSKGTAQFSDLDPLIGALNDGFGGAVEGRPGFFSWRTLISGKAASANELRKIVLFDPKRDFSRLKAAAKQSKAIRAAAADLGLTPANGVTLRLTGNAVVADEELSSLSNHIGLIVSLMLAAILLMLWLATKSIRAIFAILVTTFVGLIFAAAFGLAVFGAFNVISVAFIPLFVGLGIDFGIQLAVRFRAEQRADDGARAALIRAARVMGRSLAIAATAISIGFLAFYPTDYVGLSQLGAIAGGGLAMAFFLSVTLLPALIALAPPKGALPETSFAPIAAIDAFVLGKRRTVLTIGGLAALSGLALMPFVTFDFNPLHLRDPKSESISTVRILAADDRLTPYFISVLTPSLAEADAKGEELAKLPEVDHTITISKFIPKDQDEKLAILDDANFGLAAAFQPVSEPITPTDAETVAALADTAQKLRAAAAAVGPQTEKPDPARAAAATMLAGIFDKLAAGAPDLRAKADARVIAPLKIELEQIKASLGADRVTLDNLPAELKADWITADGRARLSIYPKGDASANAVVTKFAKAVQEVVSGAVGSPISIQESGAAVVRAFIIAGVLSFFAISLLLYVTLRRIRDVVITMTPIILTGLLTLGSSVVLGQPLNFANIIALPLLFGIGVAFHIYFVLAWRTGEGHLLQSSLARGVFFSALTTATGFGTLWLSSHPGTSSMGQLLMISLVWTLVSALLFQPALMGAAPAPHKADSKSGH